MKLKILLWGLNFLMKRNFKKNEKFNSLFETEELDFSISVRDTKIQRKFFINKDGVKSSTDLTEPSQIRVFFNDPKEAYEILTSKNKDAFMKGIQDQKVKIEGIEKDFSKMMFFQKVMGRIRI